MFNDRPYETVSFLIIFFQYDLIYLNLKYVIKRDNNIMITTSPASTIREVLSRG